MYIYHYYLLLNIIVSIVAIIVYLGWHRVTYMFANSAVPAVTCAGIGIFSQHASQQDQSSHWNTFEYELSRSFYRYTIMIDPQKSSKHDISDAPCCWNIYQHLLHQWPSFVDTYSSNMVRILGVQLLWPNIDSTISICGSARRRNARCHRRRKEAEVKTNRWGLAGMVKTMGVL